MDYDTLERRIGRRGLAVFKNYGFTSYKLIKYKTEEPFYKFLFKYLYEILIVDNTLRLNRHKSMVLYLESIDVKSMKAILRMNQVGLLDEFINLIRKYHSK